MMTKENDYNNGNDNMTS